MAAIERDTGRSRVPAAPGAAARPRGPARVPPLLALQRLAGNAAVSGLVGGRPAVQRSADTVSGTLLAQADRRAAAARAARPPEQGQQPPKQPTPAEVAVEKAKQRRSLTVRTPDTSEGRSATAATATHTKADAAKPPAPVVEPRAPGPAPTADKPRGPAAPAPPAAAAAQAAVAAAEAERAPEPPAPMEDVEPVRPVDAGGRPLPPDPVAEAKVATLTLRIRVLQASAHTLRVRATAERVQAHRVRGLITATQGKVAESETGVAMLRTHTAERRRVAGQSRTALQVSQQKATTVAAGAPKVAAKATEGRAESTRIVGETSTMAADTASKQPEDAEAAGKSQQVGGNLSKTASDATRIDSAIAQTHERAGRLQAEAQQAHAANANAAGSIAATDAALDRTDARAAQLAATNAAAKARLAGLADGPARQLAGAAAVDSEAQGVDVAATALATRLRTVQQGYAAATASVPAGIPRPVVPVQRACCEARERYDPGGAVANALPWWLTGESTPSAKERSDALIAAEERRRADLAQIDREAGGNFATLSRGDKAWLALRLTGRNLTRDVSGTGVLKFFGKLLLAFVHPGISLMGVVRGFGMIASGTVNLFSAAQWRQDPIGNLLKSLADIATGVATILGSIAMLATSIALILTAIAIIGSIFSFGAVGAALAPFIAFFGSVASTTVPLALKAAVVALALQGLVFIKDLIDASSATTAQRLQSESQAMTEDATNVGNMAMSIAMIKATQAVGRVVTARPAGAGEAAPGGSPKPAAADPATPGSTTAPPQSAGQSGPPSAPPPSTVPPGELNFVAEGPLVSIPVRPGGEPARVGEAGAGPVNTNVGLPPRPGQGDPAAADPALVNINRSDINPRPGVTEWNATQPPPPSLQGLDTLLINNPRGYDVSIPVVGQAVRPGGRIIIQGRAEVTPGMRGVNPNMTRVLRQVSGREGQEVAPGYRVVEVLTDATVPSGDPATVPKPPWVMGGPFNRTDASGPVSWPNTRIVIERLPSAPSTPPAGPGPAPGGGGGGRPAPAPAAPAACEICGAP